MKGISEKLPEPFSFENLDKRARSNGIPDAPECARDLSEFEKKLLRKGSKQVE